MKFLKRFLCVFLCAVVLAFSVGTTIFDANHMEKVEATGLEIAGAALGAEAIYQICLFIGACAATAFAVGVAVDNEEEIAKAGKSFIDSATETVDGWVMNIVDAAGQDYVFGSEALQLVQDTAWEVISGGAPGGNNDDDDDDDDDSGSIKLPTSSDEMLASFTSLGAVWFCDTAAKLYQKWMSGETLTEAESAALENILALNGGTVALEDINAQWSGEEYTYNGQIDIEYFYTNASKDIYNAYRHYYNVFGDYVSKSPVAAYLTLNDGVLNSAGTYVSYDLSLTLITACTGTYGAASYEFVKFPYSYSTYADGAWGTTYASTSYVLGYTGGYSLNGDFSMFFSTYSYLANFPIFADRESAIIYLTNNGEGYESALNYANTYQNADWLSDDWSGVLIDPYANIGLSLSQLIALAKALGLNAIQQGLGTSELADLIKKSLPAVNPDLLPDTTTDPVIEPDPDLDPIYWPSPDAHPDTDPDTDPDVDPGTGSDPDADSDTDADADPEPDLETAVDEIVPSVSSSFGDLCGSLKYKFPFSIPWDIQYMFSRLADTPKTPRFELPLVIKRFGINEVLVIDMSNLQALSTLSRSMFSILFAIYLVNLTFKVVGMRKEE